MAGLIGKVQHPGSVAKCQNSVKAELRSGLPEI
jgi:hypothetical protein